MELTGKNLIDGKWLASSDSLASSALEGFEIAQANEEQANQACLAARAAFRPFSSTSREQRATFLRCIADEIEAVGEDITAAAMAESGLPETRIVGERGRTTAQLRMFAALIEDDDYLDIRVDEAMPDRQPMPRPDIRLTHRPIGPVVVFGASNFPLAFSTAGGDTASALAAGCPVIVKGHEAHPGTTEIVAQAIAAAIEKCGMPAATFQMVQGTGHALGATLVGHAEIRAVGFTGSHRGGRALYDQCHRRERPIPFYGELGSVNPVFCLPAAMNARASEIADGWAGSLIMGAGQFCTNPGVLIAIGGPELDLFEQAAVAALNAANDQIMLTENIAKAYCQGVDRLSEVAARLTNEKTSNSPREAGAAAFKTDAISWMSDSSSYT